MANAKPIASGGILRFFYYFFAAVCVFFIVFFAITLSPNHYDAQLVLTTIIAVLLSAFVLHTSATLNAIRRHLEALEQRSGK